MDRRSQSKLIGLVSGRGSGTSPYFGCLLLFRLLLLLLLLLLLPTLSRAMVPGFDCRLGGGGGRLGFRIAVTTLLAFLLASFLAANCSSKENISFAFFFAASCSSREASRG